MAVSKGRLGRGSKNICTRIRCSQKKSWNCEFIKAVTNVILTLVSYQTLKNKGILHQYEAEDEPIRPIMDHELASAIDSLQTSTVAIEEQCRIFEVQKDALMKLKALDKPNLDVEHDRNERRRKENQEKARLDTSVWF